MPKVFSALCRKTTTDMVDKYGYEKVNVLT